MSQFTLDQAMQFALAHYRDGQLAEAEKIYRQILAQRPNHVDVHTNLGDALADQGKLDEAVAAYSAAIRLKPDCVEAWNNMGIALSDQKKFDDAIAAYSRAIQLKPGSAEVYNNLANALRLQGKLEAAVIAGRTAVQLNPDFAEAYCNLGGALQEQDKLDEALAACNRAIALKPALADAYNNLGGVLKDQSHLDESAAAFSKAIQLKPGYADAHGNLGLCLKDQGLIDEALACFDRAMALKPGDPLFHSHRLFTLHLHPGSDARRLYDEHRIWNQRHADPLKKFIQPHANRRESGRVLRIGYVSAGFRLHPVGRFLLPLLEQRDREHFQVFCYGDVRFPDLLTERFRGACDVWRNTITLSDEQLAQLVRQDGIDILVDLTMHSARSRLLTFARKPAPVQVTYLAYHSTTGLDTIDFRFTDPHMDGPGEPSSEQSVCLPETYWCYNPGIPTPAVAPPPALTAGHITFGCLNNFCKVSPPALATWIRLLQAVPNARLLLHAKEGSHRRRVAQLFAANGVDADRIQFVGPVMLGEYFRKYEEIDIALDPFPCAGGTTTCDALWMGVPVVSLAGRTGVGRTGVSILSNVGMPEWVARSQEQYIEIATKLAGDVPVLADLRASLRPRLQASPLTNAPRLAQNIETAFRQMWKSWCDRG